MRDLANFSIKDEKLTREREADRRQLDDLLGKSKAELSQLKAQLANLQNKGPDAPLALQGVAAGPWGQRNTPPFHWVPSSDYVHEFEVTGDGGEIVTKIRDFEDQGWVIPVGGSLKMLKGGIYRWTLKIEKKCPYRPQLQFGIHGLNHNQPWRLVTTSRCSRSKDDDPWQDRPGGDRLIDEGDVIHIEVDLRGLKNPYGTFAMAVNNENFETVFEDIPLYTNAPIIPVVSMGGDQSRVRLCG